MHATTVRHLHAVLHRAFASGVCQGVFVQNSCDPIDPPRVAQHTWNAFTPSEARQFMESIKGERYEALFALTISTGMRQGELLGLTWDDRDLARGTIQVRRNLQWLQDKSFIQEPKSATSWRIVYLGQSA